MVAEFFDVGEGSGWEAYDDGSLPYIRVQNSDVHCEIFLTENGALSLFPLLCSSRASPMYPACAHVLRNAHMR